MTRQTLGKYAFWLGLILAVVVALDENINESIGWVVIVIGLIGGYLRVSEKSEMHFFLMTVALFTFSGSLGSFPRIGPVLTDIISGVATFLGAAAIAVVFRNVVSWFR